MDYHKKYLKYKAKYLQLKKELEGGKLPDKKQVELVKYVDKTDSSKISHSIRIWNKTRKYFTEIYDVQVDKDNKVILNRQKTKIKDEDGNLNTDYKYNGIYTFGVCIKNTNGLCTEEKANNISAIYNCESIISLN